MSRVLVSVFVLLGIMLLSGCIYANIKTPLDTDLDRTQLGSKVGTSEYHAVLFGLIAWGDAGTKAAAEDGGITTIMHADRHFFNVLGLYQNNKTILYGD